MLPTYSISILCRGLFCALLFLIGSFWVVPAHVGGQSARNYVGHEVCKGCHEKQYQNFTTYSKKGRSFKSITTMKKGLTATEFNRCLECHTAGYGQPGGFRSETETPHLKEPGCEVCHGPASDHVKTGNPKDIKSRLTSRDCEACHNAERVAAFNYKPLIKGGAH